jgi:isopenicillin N synthase-like dioxygenase
MGIIPRIDIASLFGPTCAARDATDQAILAASRAHGFMTVAGLPPDIPIDAETRRDLLRLFTLPDAVQHRLWRQKFAPENPNLYRGWFPKQDGAVTCKEGIDIGPDIAHGAIRIDATDPLREATPLPEDAALPGWRTTARHYYLGMERTARALMASLARGLGLAETRFDSAFDGGISTLRLLHYPARDEAQLATVSDPDLWTVHDGVRVHVSGRAHVDSGFLTLLAQGGEPGLQARAHDGSWIDIAPEDGTLAVNFGKVLDRWTGGRIKATEHRVIGTSRARHSVPFFYEPRVDAVIAPLPGSAPFEPFVFGDYLWATTTKFVEFHGMEALRPPRGMITL